MLKDLVFGYSAAIGHENPLAWYVCLFPYQKQDVNWKRGKK